MKPKGHANYIDANLLLRKDNLIAFVLRQNTSWMNGFYSLPAGRVDPDETYLQAAVREAEEEAGVVVEPKDVSFVHVMHRREETDWVSVFFEAVKWEGDVYNAEPHLHESLDWFDPDHLPENVVPSIAHAIAAINQGQLYSEYGWDV